MHTHKNCNQVDMGSPVTSSIGCQAMFDIIFERILNALSFDIAIIDLHSKYATNFAYPFLLRGFVKHMLFSVAVPSTL